LSATGAPLRSIGAHQVGNRPVGEHMVRFTGTVDCIVKTVRYEGVRALWNGSTARVARLVPGQAITFGAFQYFSSLLERYS
jgi:hypothetical protein